MGRRQTSPRRGCAGCARHARPPLSPSLPEPRAELTAQKPKAQKSVSFCRRVCGLPADLLPADAGVISHPLTRVTSPAQVRECLYVKYEGQRWQPFFKAQLRRCSSPRTHPAPAPHPPRPRPAPAPHSPLCSLLTHHSSLQAAEARGRIQGAAPQGHRGGRRTPGGHSPLCGAHRATAAAARAGQHLRKCRLTGGAAFTGSAPLPAVSASLVSTLLQVPQCG